MNDLLTKVFGTSWSTSISGVIGILLSLLVLVVLWAVDYDWKPIAAILVPTIVIALGQMMTRANKVSDQQAGVRPEPPIEPKKEG